MATTTIFTYAVIESAGMHGSSETVWAHYRTNDLGRAQARARALTAQYQELMRRHGGSSGHYRVVAWGQRGNIISYGRDADAMPTVVPE